MVKIPKLTPRLQLVADMLSSDATYSEKVLADVGTDHAKLPIFALATSSVVKAYASDLRKGPLKKAMANIRFYLEDNADSVITVLGDGTENIPSDYNYLTISGVGGDLTASILAHSNARFNTVFLLSPMTGAEKLRRFLYENGYEITEELLAKEEKKIYTVIKAKNTGKKTEYEEIDLYFSKALIESGNIHLKDYVRKYISKIEKSIMGRELSENSYSDIDDLRRLEQKMISLEESL